MIDPEIKIRIQQRISKIFGLHFHENQWSSIEHHLKNVAKDLKISNDLESLGNLLEKDFLSEAEFDVLSKHLTVGETYFFREKSALRLFREKIIPQLIRERAGKHQHIRIWSAGCSSGEEPYTLAMILNEEMQDLNRWKIDILATDINADALRRAKTGIYTPWSFRETSDEMKKKYFSPVGSCFEINSQIKNMVSFEKLNLAKDDFPSANNHTHNFDIVFCRNVLMYFMPETAKEIARRFYLALNENGWLITSQVELNDDYFSEFARKMYYQGIFYQKTENRSTKHAYSDISIDQGSMAIPEENTLKSLHKRKPKADKKQAFKTLKQDNVNKAPVIIEATMPAAGLFANAQYSECAIWCENYLKGNPFDSPIALLLVKSYANAGKLTEARKWTEQLISADGSTAEILNFYATILMEQNELEKAETILIKTLYMHPEHLAANLNLANTMKKLGKTNPALKYYEHLLYLLDKYDDNVIIPDLDGMTAGRLRQIIKLMIR